MDQFVPELPNSTLTGSPDLEIDLSGCHADCQSKVNVSAALILDAQFEHCLLLLMSRPKNKFSKYIIEKMQTGHSDQKKRERERVREKI